METTAKLHLYNTASRELELLDQKTPVRIYTCGPTVYNYAHIGNFRTYVFEDILRRAIKFFGMQVNQAMNLTDVDDKTIRGAIQEKVSLNDYTKKYKEAFFADIETLGIEKVEHYPQATDYIGHMVQLIETLLAKEIAYRGKDHSIYYNIEKFPSYGKLSGLKVDELKAGASERVASDEYEKEHVSDFVLWKAYDPERDGAIFWESPFGPGRPGWHIECSAMAMSLLGESLDIHVGGVDNIFPHHENEIAQSEGCTGKCFAKLWLHAEHLLFDQRKMSKSAGNFYTLRDLLEKGFSGLEVRYLLLQSHYRMQLNFTFAGLEASKNALTRLHTFIGRLKEQAHPSSFDEKPLSEAFFNQFAKALADDLNTPQALAALFDFVREVNTLIDQGLIGQESSQRLLETLSQVDSVLNVLFKEEETIPAAIEALFEERLQARQTKQWALADQLRDQILALGFLIEDSPSGSRLKKM
ncbi:MAG: cysS [Chlamydiales bacterium]|jgi:cysteinyl-tRNA synthetase|nr:cysS [Chlamydiales bacterium]